MRRVVGADTIELPSVEATHWELMGCIVLLDFFSECVRDCYIVVHSDSIVTCKCVADLTAAREAAFPLAHLTRRFLGRI